MPELKDVQDKVRADAIGEKAFARARVTAAELRARAEREGLDKAATALGLARKQTDALIARGQALGDLGSTAALEAAVYALPTSGLSDPVRTAAGWAVVRVLEKKEADSAAFEAQRAGLIASLTEERRAQLFRAYMQEARKRFPVQRRPDALRRVDS